MRPVAPSQHPTFRQLAISGATGDPKVISSLKAVDPWLSYGLERQRWNRVPSEVIPL